MAERVMPFLGKAAAKSDWPGYPWRLLEPHAQQAIHNHGQTLERLAERGGLCATEMLAIMEDRPLNWNSKPDEAAAYAKLLKLAKPEVAASVEGEGHE